MPLNEFDLIKRIIKKIPRKLQGPLGIGDDTAVLNFRGKKKWLFTTDVLVDGVDFISGKTPPRLVGRKALAVNISDVAAMGGEPSACLVSLGIPRRFNPRWIDLFYDGLIQLAQKYKIQCAGGDISRSREFFVSVALLGISQSGKIITRSDACRGDAIFVTGELGGSILRHHLLFEPRLEESRFLIRYFHPTSMIDISDGLIQDLEHILELSRCGASMDVAFIPVSRDARRLAKGNRVRALEHALTDGEDFELLFTVPSREKEKLLSAWKKRFPKVSLSVIGEMTSARQKIVWCREGKRVPAPKLKKKGFSHF